jgi:hypothetical protein
MALSLARFTVTKALDETFIMVIEDDSGTTLELEATEDQLETIVEAIEDAMDSEAEAQDEDDEVVEDD